MSLIDGIILNVGGVASVAAVLHVGLGYGPLGSVLFAAVAWLLLFGAWRLVPGATALSDYLTRNLPGQGASRSPSDLRLTLEQQRLLIEALADGFTPSELNGIIRVRLGRGTSNLITGIDAPRLDQLVAKAQRERWLSQLIDTAYEAKPGNKKMALLVSALGQTGAGRIRSSLERIVRESVIFDHVDDFLFRLTRIELSICRISYPTPAGTVYGTGFLVGPDLLLTNEHVISALLKGEAEAGDVELAFDYKQSSDGGLGSWTSYRLHSDWLVAHSPPSKSDLLGIGTASANELDFALLRLGDRVGELPIGKAATVGKAAPRGWIPINPQPVPHSGAGAIAMIIQHPEGAAKRIAFGEVIAFTSDGLRVTHNVNTVAGSSGAPMLTADIRLFALHHAGDPNFDRESKPTYNQAIPMTKVITHLKEKKVQPFWENKSPISNRV